jgi:hypothetical protein
MFGHAQASRAERAVQESQVALARAEGKFGRSCVALDKAPGR